MPGSTFPPWWARSTFHISTAVNVWIPIYQETQMTSSTKITLQHLSCLQTHLHPGMLVMSYKWKANEQKAYWTQSSCFNTLCLKFCYTAIPEQISAFTFYCTIKSILTWLDSAIVSAKFWDRKEGWDRRKLGRKERKKKVRNRGIEGKSKDMWDTVHFLCQALRIRTTQVMVSYSCHRFMYGNIVVVTELWLFHHRYVSLTSLNIMMKSATIYNIFTELQTTKNFLYLW